jgi:amino acid permease
LVVANSGTLQVLSVFVFGYTCHQNAFPIVNELKNNSQKRINYVIFLSLGTALVVYTIVAVSGYYTFGGLVSGDVTDNYPHNLLMAGSRVFIALMVAMSFPLQCHPCRNSINYLLYNSTEVPWRRHIVMTTCILAGSFGLSMIVTSLGVVLAIVGATGSTTISYVLPGLVYVCVHKEWTFTKCCAALLLTVGCIIIPSCLTFIALYGSKSG